MDKFAVDYDLMNNILSTKKAYKYNDVKNHLIKVAFDVVKFREADNIDGLWQIQNTDDGEIIVALYEEGPKLEAKSSWSAIFDKTASFVHIFYKNDPITKIAMNDIKVENKTSFIESLPKMLEENDKIRSIMLKEVSAHDKENIIKKYPELG